MSIKNYQIGLSISFFTPAVKADAWDGHNTFSDFPAWLSPRADDLIFYFFTRWWIDNFNQVHDTTRQLTMTDSWYYYRNHHSNIVYWKVRKIKNYWEVGLALKISACFRRIKILAIPFSLLSMNCNSPYLVSVWSIIVPTRSARSSPVHWKYIFH